MVQQLVLLNSFKGKQQGWSFLFKPDPTESLLPRKCVAVKFSFKKIHRTRSHAIHDSVGQSRSRYVAYSSVRNSLIPFQRLKTAITVLMEDRLLKVLEACLLTCRKVVDG